MTKDEEIERLKEVLLETVTQACYVSKGKDTEPYLESFALTAYAEALVLLDSYGLVKLEYPREASGGRRVFAHFINREVTEE